MRRLTPNYCSAFHTLHTAVPVRFFFVLLLLLFHSSDVRFMRPDAVPSAEWIPLEAPSGRIKDRMKVQVTTVASFDYVHVRGIEIERKNV